MAFDVTLVAPTLPAELRWRLYAALGRGIRVIDPEYRGPTYKQVTFSIQHHLATMQECARTYRRIATVEDLLVDGRRGDAPVAILHSQGRGTVEWLAGHAHAVHRDVRHPIQRCEVRDLYHVLANALENWTILGADNGN